MNDKERKALTNLFDLHRKHAEKKEKEQNFETTACCRMCLMTQLKPRVITRMSQPGLIGPGNKAIKYVQHYYCPDCALMYDADFILS